MKLRIVRKDINESNTSGNLATHAGRDIEVTDYVIFKKQKMQVIGKTHDHRLILLSPESYTIECSPEAVKPVLDGKDSTPKEFKFDRVTGKLLDEKIVPCRICFKGIDVMNEEMYVKFGEWLNAPDDNALVNVINENERLYSVPKGDIIVQALPTVQQDMDADPVPPAQQMEDAQTEIGLDPKPGKEWQYGVEISKEGQPLRKLLINSVSYTSSKNDTDGISVLFFTQNGYKAGIVPKELLSPVLAK